MKRFLVSLLAIFILSFSTLSANFFGFGCCDPCSCAPSWKSVYLGFNTGWGWTKNRYSATPFGPIAVGPPGGDFVAQSHRFHQRGGILGLQGGHNWQCNCIVYGLEADYDLAHISGFSRAIHDSAIVAAIATDRNISALQSEIESLATIRGRLGGTWGCGFFYLTAGFAWEHLKNDTIHTLQDTGGLLSRAINAKFQKDIMGWAAGAGLEWRICQCWSVRAEYLHYNFNKGDSRKEVFAPIGPAAATPQNGLIIRTGKTKINTFRLGLNFIWNYCCL